jgi:predicted transcriptional regulator
MKTILVLERLEKIHNLIKVGKTGTPKEFAKKIKISQSQLYYVLDDLKIKGFPIKYSRKLKSYVYKPDCQLEIDYSIRLIVNGKTIKIEES